MKAEIETSSAWASDGFPHAPDETNTVATVAAIKRRWRLVVGFVAVSCVLTYVLCQFLTPLYAAKTSVMIDPREPKPAASHTDQAALPPSEETLRKNEIAIIRSRRVADAVIGQLSLDQEPEFNPGIRPPSTLRSALAGLGTLLTYRGAASSASQAGTAESTTTSRAPEEQVRQRAIDLFLGRLTTTSTDASRVIEVRFLSENPERAARIANLIANQYIAEKVEMEIAGAQATARSLDQSIEMLNGKIRESERRIEEIRSEHGLLVNPDERVMTEELSELNKQLAMATAERMGAEGRLAEVQSRRGTGGADSASSVLGSLLIQHLQEEAARLNAKIGEMLATYGDSHPKIVQARAELSNLQAKIEAEVGKITNSYRNALIVAKAKEASLRQQIAELKAQVVKANASEVDVRLLERETEGNRNLLSQLVARLNDTKAQIHLQGPAAWVLSAATIPQSPSFPPKLAMVAAAFLISGTGATILAAMLERGDSTIRSTVQIRQLTSARVLGAVPMVKGANKARRAPQSHVLARRRSQFVENLHSIWFQIENYRPNPAQVLLITSSVAGEGKSVTASCLARMLAVAGRRIVIVDGDLRNPSVHRLLGAQQSPGLADFVAEASELDDVMQMDSASGAHVIAAGAPVLSPADVLQSSRFQTMLKALSGEFETVIIDSPPVLPVHDAAIIARHADATVMAVRWGETTTATFVTALQRMSDFNISVTGVILSMADSQKYGVYGHADSEIFSRGVRKYYPE